MGDGQKLTGNAAIAGNEKKDEPGELRPLHTSTTVADNWQQPSHSSSDGHRMLPADSPGVVRPAVFEGQISGVDGNRIVGWAWDVSRPFEPIGIELFIGDLRVGHGTADVFDIELAREKRGNGKHRFEIGLERLPASRPPFLVRAAVTESDAEIGTPLTLPNLEIAERLLLEQQYIGRVTGVERGSLCGWVLNRSNSHDLPALTLRDGDTKISTMLPVRSAKETLDSGVSVNVHRFELPLPTDILDGRQHILSVSAGTSDQSLPGSPILFGPADLTSLTHKLVTTFDALQALALRVDNLQPSADPAASEKRVTRTIFERVDMLLNIHRDAIERELSVLRRTIARIGDPSIGEEPDLIEPISSAPSIDEELRPTSAQFTVLDRSAPLLSYNLETRPDTAIPSGKIAWSKRAGPPGLSILGTGSVQLAAMPENASAIILTGAGAREPFEFCGMVASLHGRPLAGRVEIEDDGKWTFFGKAIGPLAERSAARGLSIAYLPAARASGTLTLNWISAYYPSRAPDSLGGPVPSAAVHYIDGESGHRGFYPAEAGPAGGICWMGGSAELAFRVRQTGFYRLTMPGIRSLVPGLIPRLRLSLGGTPLKTEIVNAIGDTSVCDLNAECHLPVKGNDTLSLRFSVPEEFIRSPQELGLNEDQRPLTIAVRTVALRALRTDDQAGAHASLESASASQGSGH